MMIVFTVIGVAGGLAMLRWREQVARFFRAAAEPLYPEKVRSRLYSAENVRWVGGGFVAFGLLAMCILIWRVAQGYGFA